MQDKLTLMIPGPTPVPETVLKAMGRHPIGHRSGEFQAIVERTTCAIALAAPDQQRRAGDHRQRHRSHGSRESSTP